MPDDIVDLAKKRDEKQREDKDVAEKKLTQRFQKAMGLNKKKWPKVELKKRTKKKKKK